MASWDETFQLYQLLEGNNNYVIIIWKALEES